MPQYMLVLRADPAGDAVFQALDQQVMYKRYKDWRESVEGQGKKLKDLEGRVMRKGDGAPVVTDGPFAESKEVLGGFFVVTADSYDNVVGMAATCPHLDFGSIEIREVAFTG